MKIDFGFAVDNCMLVDGCRAAQPPHPRAPTRPPQGLYALGPVVSVCAA